MLSVDLKIIIMAHNNYYIVGCGVISFYLSLYLSRQGHNVTILDIREGDLANVDSGTSSQYLSSIQRWGNLKLWGAKIWLPCKLNYEKILNNTNSHFKNIRYTDVLDIYEDIRELGFPKCNRRELETNRFDFLSFCRKYHDYDAILQSQGIKSSKATLCVKEKILTYDKGLFDLTSSKANILFCLGSIQNAYVKNMLEESLPKRIIIYGKKKFLAQEKVNVPSLHVMCEILNPAKYTSPLMYWFKQVYGYQSLYSQLKLLKIHKFKMLRQYGLLYFKSIVATFLCICNRKFGWSSNTLYYNHFVHDLQLDLDFNHIRMQDLSGIKLSYSTLEDSNHNTGTIGRGVDALQDCFDLKFNRKIKFLGTSATDFPMVGNPTLLSLILGISYLMNENEY